VRIGIVRNAADFQEGGCTLQFATDSARHNQRNVFLSDLGDSAVMNIDGKDVKLGLVRRQERKGEPKKGDRSTCSYAAKGITVRVDFVVTGLCDPNDESCEVVYYDATITVARGDGKRAIKVKGMCGS
jgi:hypothetical protein